MLEYIHFPNVELFAFSNQRKGGHLLVRYLWVKMLYELHLYFRMQKFLLGSKNVVPEKLAPFWPVESFEKTRLYTTHKENLEITRKFCTTTVITILFSAEAHKSWPLSDSIALALVFYVIHIPYYLYLVFVIEQSYGFNRQTLQYFLKDHAKRILIITLVICPLFGVKNLEDDKHKVTRLPESYTLVSWIALLVLIEFVVAVADQFILPLFLTFTEIPEGSFRKRMEAVADRLSFPISNISIVNASQRTWHTNVVFFGFALTKRIIVFDTILPTSERSLKSDASIVLTEPELEALIVREMGRWKLGQIVYNIVLVEWYGRLLFWLIVIFMERYFPKTETDTWLNLISAIMLVLGSGDFIMNKFTRRIEFSADRFATELGYGPQMCSALPKVFQQNCSFPRWEFLYSLWYDYDPSIIERLDYMAEVMEEMEAKNK